MNKQKQVNPHASALGKLSMRKRLETTTFEERSKIAKKGVATRGVEAYREMQRKSMASKLAKKQLLNKQK